MEHRVGGPKKKDPLSSRADRGIAVVVLCLMCCVVIVYVASQRPAADVIVADVDPDDYDREEQRNWAREEELQKRNEDKDVDEPKIQAELRRIRVELGHAKMTIKILDASIKDGEKAAKKAQGELEDTVQRQDKELKEGSLERLRLNGEMEKAKPLALPDMYVTQHKGDGTFVEDCNKKHAIRILPMESGQCLGSVQLFQDGSFDGWTAEFPKGEHNAKDIVTNGGRDDDASSLKVPIGCKVVVYGNEDFTGWETEFPAGDYDFSAFESAGAENDELSSLRVMDASDAKVRTFDTKSAKLCVVFKGHREQGATYKAVSSPIEALKAGCSHGIPVRPIILSALGDIFIKVCRPCGNQLLESVYNFKHTSASGEKKKKEQQEALLLVQKQSEAMKTADADLKLKEEATRVAIEAQVEMQAAPATVVAAAENTKAANANVEAEPEMKANPGQVVAPVEKSVKTKGDEAGDAVKASPMMAKIKDAKLINAKLDAEAAAATEEDQFWAAPATVVVAAENTKAASSKVEAEPKVKLNPGQVVAPVVKAVKTKNGKAGDAVKAALMMAKIKDAKLINAKLEAEAAAVSEKEMPKEAILDNMNAPMNDPPPLAAAKPANDQDESVPSKAEKAIHTEEADTTVEGTNPNLKAASPDKTGREDDMR